MEGPRWWMGCQPHIRVLRAVIRSRIEIGAFDVPLHECVSLYMAGIQEHSALEDEKVLRTMAGGEVTATEASFMWLGGWRPSSALLLVCSLMCVQIQDDISNLELGIPKSGRSDSILSDKQLVSLRNVRKRLHYEENKLSKKLATIQMLVSDQDVIAAVLNGTNPPSIKPHKTDFESVFKPRMSRLKRLLIQADQLRLQTLHQLFLVLTPVQVAHSAIAAFELAFCVHAAGVAEQRRGQRHAPAVVAAAISSVKPLSPRVPLGLQALGGPSVCGRYNSRSETFGQKESVMWSHRSTCQT